MGTPLKGFPLIFVRDGSQDSQMDGWSETTARELLQKGMKCVPNREPPEVAMITSINI